MHFCYEEPAITSPTVLFPEKEMEMDQGCGIGPVMDGNIWQLVLLDTTQPKLGLSAECLGMITGW